MFFHLRLYRIIRPFFVRLFASFQLSFLVYISVHFCIFPSCVYRVKKLLFSLHFYAFSSRIYRACATFYHQPFFVRTSAHFPLYSAAHASQVLPKSTACLHLLYIFPWNLQVHIGTFEPPISAPFYHLAGPDYRFKQLRHCPEFMLLLVTYFYSCCHCFFLSGAMPPGSGTSLPRGGTYA